MPHRGVSAQLRSGCLTLLVAGLIVRPLLSAEVFPAWAVWVDALLMTSAGGVLALTGPRALTQLARVRLPLIGWAIALGMGLALHASTLQGWRDMSALAGGPALLCASALTWGRHRRWLVQGLLAIATLIAAFAIQQVLVILPELAGRSAGAAPGTTTALLYQVAERGRALGTFSLPTLLAGYLSLMIPLAVGACLQQSPPKLFRWLRWLTLFTVCAAWLLTGSIGAWLSLFAACGIVALGFVRGASWRWLLPGSVVVLLAGSLIVVARPALRDWSDPHHPIHNRLVYWDAARRLMTAHPIAGTGPGTFEVGYRQVTTQPELGVKHAHNTYLQLWVEWGLAGLIGWSMLLASILRSARVVTPWLGVVLWALPLHNLMDFTFYVPQVSLLWWSLAGWSLRLRRYQIPS